VETDETLETGYGPGVAAGDNVLNDYAQFHAEGFAELADARGDRVEKDADFAIVMADSGSPMPFGNAAFLRRPLDASEWPRAVARMHEFFAKQPGGPFMLFSGWPTPDLRPFQFGLVGHPPLMLRAAGSDTREVPENLEITPVVDVRTATDWEYAIVHGYPAPELQPFRAGCFLPVPALGAPRWRHWVGYIDGRPVATASAFLAPTHVDVEFVSALPETRGQGVGYALTVAATVADPALPAVLIASDLGRPTYERMGYVPILRYTLWVGHRRS
jgi:hypothetical protein